MRSTKGHVEGTCMHYFSPWCKKVTKSNFKKEGFILIHGLKSDTRYYGKEGERSTVGSGQYFILGQEVDKEFRGL